MITPNIPEAEILSKIKIKILRYDKCCQSILKLGAKNVLTKGGHSKIKKIKMFS